MTTQIYFVHAVSASICLVPGNNPRLLGSHALRSPSAATALCVLQVLAAARQGPDPCPRKDSPVAMDPLVAHGSSDDLRSEFLSLPASRLPTSMPPNVLRN